MVNYSNGKIYKIELIIEHPEEDIYIGSTTKQYLSQRMDKHRSSYKCWKDLKINKFTVFDLFDKYGIDNCKIYLLESVKANNKDELRAREGHYIRTLKCVNKRIENRTRKEYREQNKDKIKVKIQEYYQVNKEKLSEHNKQYYNDNKEKIKKRKAIYRQINREVIREKSNILYNKNNTKIKCDICNVDVVKFNFNRHRKTKKHQSNLQKHQSNLQK